MQVVIAHSSDKIPYQPSLYTKKIASNAIMSLKRRNVNGKYRNMNTGPEWNITEVSRLHWITATEVSYSVNTDSFIFTCAYASSSTVK